MKGTACTKAICRLLVHHPIALPSFVYCLKAWALLYSRSKEAQGLRLCPCYPGLPEDVNDGGEYCCMRPTSATLHGLKGVQGMAPLATLLVGSDKISVRDCICLAVMLGHPLEHQSSLVVFPAVRTGRNHAVENAYIWLAALQRGGT